MKISIARDGNVLGEYDESEIAPLARGQVLQPTDLYWQEGQPDWQPLTELVGSEPWQAEPGPEPSPAPEPAAESEPVPVSEPPTISEQSPTPERLPAMDLDAGLTPQFSDDPNANPVPDPAPRPALGLSRKAIVGIVLAWVLVAIGAPFYFRGLSPAKVGGSGSPTAATPRAITEPPAQDPEAQLKAKIANLQKPPKDLLYENISYEVKPFDSPYASFVGTISGRESILNDETHKTDFVLDFTVTVGFQDGEWFYDHATGEFYSTSDYKKIPVVEDFHEPRFLRNLITALPLRPEPRNQPR